MQRMLLKQLSLIILAGASLLSSLPATAQTPTLYTIDSASLHTINPLTGALESTVALTVPGDPLAMGGFGLAVSPTTNEMYAVVKLFLGPGFNRHLVRINPYTGIATVIGSMDQSIAGLAFDGTGVLYAVSSDCTTGCGGVPTPETLFTVDLSDASLTLFQMLGNGGDGEAIAFNPNDGLMYHMSGSGADLVFESIDLSNGTVTSIPLSGSPISGRLTSGLAFDASRNLFLASLIDLQIFTFVTLTPGGTLTDVGNLAGNQTDLAFFNASDIDTDGDGIPDEGDAFPGDPAEWADTDGDGVGDNADAFPFDPGETADTDGDGVGDNSDAFPFDPSETADSDGDGVGDNSDAFPNDPSETTDTDGDGVGDNADDFPFDPAETTDTDGDGIGNNTDPDDDNDGVPDAQDDFPLGRFDDAPPGYWAFTFIEALARAVITSGCGPTIYCPEDSVTRAQMAVFLERGMRGSGYNPPAATGNTFLDVGAGDFAAAFIEQLSQDGITSGCGGNNYCPTDSVTRAQMAVFLLRAKHGAGYTPPAPSGVFGDVDLAYWAVAWIEQLAAEGITSGCGGGNYCPEDPVTRAQMAVFLVRTFGL